MEIQFNFVHLDVSDSLKDYTVSSLEHIGRFLLKGGQSHCFFSKTKSQFSVEITVNTREKYFKAVATEHDIYVAVDMAIEKLERQFIKTRKVYRNHKNFDSTKSAKFKDLNSMLEYKVPFKKVD